VPRWAPVGWRSIPWLADALLVLVLGGMAVYEASAHIGFLVTRSDLVVMSLFVGALFFRRGVPLVLVGALALATFVWYQSPTGGAWTADTVIGIAVYTVAALRGLWWGLVAAGASVAAYAPVCSGTCMVGWAVQFGFVVIAGIAVREGRRLNAELLEKTQLLDSTREERVRQAVEDERSTVARNVHDMVAHGVTLMVIQAGAARWLVDGDRARADRALQSVEQAGEEALRELNALVETLGSTSGNELETLPTVGVLSIRALVGHAVESGMKVELVVEGDPGRLDEGLELSLYRIVQESLTNVRKHAPGARVWVELRYSPAGVEVEVVNGRGDGAARGRPVPGAGQGLVGIAERAALFGGRLEAGPLPDGGFGVRVSLAEERVPG
jgi:signal transduction histidine kinase